MQVNERDEGRQRCEQANEKQKATGKGSDSGLTPYPQRKTREEENWWPEIGMGDFTEEAVLQGKPSTTTGRESETFEEAF